jgi:hypothetical protein
LVSSWPRIIPDDPSCCETTSKSLVSLSGGPFRDENGAWSPADVVALWSW